MSSAADAGGATRRGLLGYLAHHPKGFWFIFWGELAERSSYYGMRAILLLYMSTQLGLGDQMASFAMSQFIAAAYFLPLVGGYIADNYFGKYWTIVGFSIPYILGHVILGVESVPFLIIALALLAMGSGVIKPNISTLMGLTYDQKRPGEEQLRSDAFAMYYAAINIGSAISTFMLPFLRDRYGYAIAFLFPAALMAVAFVFFAAGKKHYAVEVIDRTPPSPEEKQQRRLVIRRIFGLFFVICFFWSIFDQQASTWTFFARDLLDLSLFGVTLAPDAVQAFNPVFVLTLLPIVTLAWRGFAAWGYPLRATDKMIVGFVFTALSMAMMAVPAWMAHQTVDRLSKEGAHFVLFDDEATPEVAEIAERGAGYSIVHTVADVQALELDDPEQVVYVPQLPLSPEGIYANYIADRYDFITLSEKADLALKLQLNRTESPTNRVARVRSVEEVGSVEIEPEAERVALIGAEDLATGESAALVEALQERYPGIVSPRVGGSELVKAVTQRYQGAIELPKPSVIWQILAYVIVTVAELCISVVGLELAFTAAPKSMKGFITGCFLLTVFFANQLNAVITPQYPKMPAYVFFILMAAMMIPVSLAFLFIARRFNRSVERLKEEEAHHDSEGNPPKGPIEGHVQPGD
ncbi:POT-type proton-dependent oligopeptide transporter [Tautonia marina]|uniref:POT-type proton-dependent oligopeptide transporter n=1 Tax=Tautonia marina TaxID=2653855 RepID=UPI0012605FE2|nr:oligopeptide:H+ symporter [Tautonia marina]